MSAQATRVNQTPAATHPAPRDPFALPSGGEEEALIKLDLADLELPKVNNLQVEGLDKPWWGRLLGR